MRGKAGTAGTLESYIPFGISLLAKFSHLTAKSFLVALAQHHVVMVKDIATNVVAHPRRSHIPRFVHLKEIVTGQCHDGQFHHQMKEDLIAMLDDDIVSEAAVMLQAFANITLKLGIKIPDTLGQFCSLFLCAAGHE